MAWRISWHLSCDHCKAKGTFAGSPSSAVEKKARARGWSIEPDEWKLIRHYCPECAKRRAKEASEAKGA